MTAKQDKTSALATLGEPFALEVIEGPMDGALLVGALARVSIGRTGGNDFELHSDRSVSGEHAVLSRRPDGWRLEDLRSTNGTFVDDQNLRDTGPRDLPPACDFMIGHTVVRTRPAGGDASFTPDAPALKAETARLAARFTPAAAEGYGAAVALALVEKRPYLSDRHLFWGLSAMNPDLPLLQAAGGPVPSRFLTGPLLANEFWLGDQGWIHRRLKTSILAVEGFFETDLTVTPRLLALLLAAEAAADGRQIGPRELLTAYLTGPVNRTRELLARAGLAVEDLLPALGAPAPAAVAVPRVEIPAPLPARGAAHATSGDPALDARAQEMARGLYGVAALYGLAAAEDRFAALKQLLTQEVARMPGESRIRILHQLRRLFPVTGGTDLDSTLSAFRELQRREAAPPPEVAAPPPGDAIPWRPLLDAGKGGAWESLAGSERAAAELISEVYAFAVTLERFLVSVVHGLKSQGVGGTQTMQLPGYRTSIQRFARDLATGKPFVAEDLRDYLAAVETWLVALVASYSEAPELWFKELWSKLSPAAIESRAGDDKRLLRLDSLTFWNRYKERAHGITPDLAADQIQRRVWQRAEEQFKQFFEKRRRPS